MKISIVIPSYKNKEMLIRNLEHNLPYLEGHEIIVVNDYPPESLQNEMKKFPAVTLIENKINLGFGSSVNKGVSQAHHEYVFLLNTDVKLNNTNFMNAVEHLKKDSKLFAVTLSQKEKNGEIVGKNVLFWKRGLLFHKKASLMTSGVTAWFEGGSAIVSKKLFEELGGFDPIFKPFYWEDIDLSYRAWKKGYAIFFDQEIQVTHEHESTIGTYFDQNSIKRIAFRNQFICIWKNISDANLVYSHYLLLPFNLLYYVIKGEINFVLGFIDALKYIENIRKQKNTLCSDHEILKLFYE
ncbi:MAG: glycosyltransferase family 2 protein [bacterium]|nr:glycosyltransferase family 2 protein [bacterium]